MKPIRVLLVDDSPTVLERLRSIIESDSRLEVIGAVRTGEEAVRLVHRLAPDVISMDIRMPGIDGFEATQRIMAEKPTPIVVVSSSVEDLDIAINALRAGALAVVEKPPGRQHGDFGSIAGALCTQLAIMSEVRVVRQRIRPRLTSVRTPPPRPPGPFRMIGLVASTGGPAALARMLGQLEPDFPLPVLLVQHITASFLGGFVSWLGGQCRLRVLVAEGGEVPAAGTVYVAPADRHLVLQGACLALTDGPLVDGQRPSGTVLLHSLAVSLERRGIGVVLTGMGADGAEGLFAMQQAGGYTVAEDASTAIVYGMPAAAVQRGAVCESLPLADIAPRLVVLAAAQGGP